MIEALVTVVERRRVTFRVLAEDFDDALDKYPMGNVEEDIFLEDYVESIVAEDYEEEE